MRSGSGIAKMDELTVELGVILRGCGFVHQGARRVIAKRGFARIWRAIFGNRMFSQGRKSVWNHPKKWKFLGSSSCQIKLSEKK